MTYPRTPQAVIAELMHVSSAAKPDTVFFAADIGNVGEDANWWKLLKDGKTLKIQLPRSITTFYREPKVCFWLIEMPEPFARVYSIEDFILSREEAENHKTRIFAAWKEYGEELYVKEGKYVRRTNNNRRSHSRADR